MSFEDWRQGLHAGLQQDFIPALRERDAAWFRACKEIIDRCVAPDMHRNAMGMLERAMHEAGGPLEESAGVRKQPSDQLAVNRRKPLI